MRIHEITLQEVRMKLVAPFETSMDRTVVRRIVLVQADVDGVIGWAECVAGETPYYSPETADTASVDSAFSSSPSRRKTPTS